MDGASQVVPVALLGDNRLVDFACRHIGVFRKINVDKALVVPEVQIGLGPVVGDKHLAVLVRAHRARVDIDIGIELFEGDFVAAAFEKASEGCRCNALAEGRNNAACYEYVFSHIASGFVYKPGTLPFDCFDYTKRGCDVSHPRFVPLLNS